MGKTEGANHLLNFCYRLEEVYTFSALAQFGFIRFRHMLEDAVADPGRPTTVASAVFLGPGNPNDADATFVTKLSTGEIIDKCASGGENEVQLSRLAILAAYAFWEHEARPNLAKALNMPIQEISSAVFGDLNKYRQAISHSGSILDRKPEVLSFVGVGQPVSLRSGQLQELIFILTQEASVLSQRLCETPLSYSFYKNLKAR